MDKGIETVSTRINVHDNNNFSVTPFKNINANLPYANLNWWKDYQAIKHDRIHNVKRKSSKCYYRFIGSFSNSSSFNSLYTRRQWTKLSFEKTWSEYWIPAV